MEGLFDRLKESKYWIPTFPEDFRKIRGFTISMVLLFWASLILVVGMLHKICSGTSVLIVLAFLLVGFIVGKVTGAVVNDRVGDSYLNAREKAFGAIIDQWNLENKAKGAKADLGRWGSFVSIEFSKPNLALGKYLMKMKKFTEVNKAKQKEQDQAKKTGDDY